jgi:hypothetical protein
MGEFRSGIPVRLTLFDGGRARLDDAVEYETDDGHVYVAPLDMVFDGASIPRAAWSAVGHPFDARYLPAAVIHDALYQQQVTTRARADAVFREALRANGVNRVRATTMWLAVRVGGAGGWNAKRETEAP